MSNRVMQRPRLARVAVLACASAFLALAPQVSRAQEPECLIEIHDQNGAVSDEGTLCAVSPASPKFCTFNLALCHNEPGCTVGKLKKRVHATGHCNPAKLTVSPTDSSCGAFTGIKVRTRGNGKKPGKCRIRVGAKSSDKPAMTDVDKVLLTCMPAGTSCP